MKKYLGFVAISVFLLSCTNTDRDNPYDMYAVNYIGNISAEGSSSSVETDDEPSSSSVVYSGGSVEPSSSSEASSPSSSSVESSSSSALTSSSSTAPSSSSVALYSSSALPISSSSSAPPACVGDACATIPAFTCTWDPNVVTNGDMSKVKVTYTENASNCRAKVWVQNYVTNSNGFPATTAIASFVLDTDIRIAGRNPEGVTIEGATNANFEWPGNATVASKATVTCGSGSTQNEKTQECPLIIGPAPAPTVTGSVSFKSYSYSSGSTAVFFIGTEITAANNVTHNVTVTNNTLAGCGEPKVEFSGCGAALGATSVTPTAACTITTKVVAECRGSTVELKTAEAKVAPNPTLSGTCAWSKNPTSSALGAIPSGVLLSNAYGRCGTSTDGALPTSAYSGGKYSSWPANGVVDAGTYSVSTNVTCATTQVSCP